MAPPLPEGDSPENQKEHTSSRGAIRVALDKSQAGEKEDRTKPMRIKSLMRGVGTMRRAAEIDKVLAEVDRDGDGTIDAGELVDLVENLIDTRRERRYMWFTSIALLVLGAVLIGAIIGLTYAVVAALKDTKIDSGVMYVKNSEEVVRVGSAEFSVVGGVMVDRDSMLAANASAKNASTPPPSAVLQTASFLGTPVPFSSRVDISVLFELKFLHIKGAGDVELGVVVNGVARVPQPGSVYGTVVLIITAAGTITLDGTAITFSSEVADLFVRAGFRVSANRRALLGVYDVLGFFNVIKDLSAINLPDSQATPALPSGNFVMKLKVWEPCKVADSPQGDRCVYVQPDLPSGPAVVPEDVGADSPPTAGDTGANRRSRHLYAKTVPRRSLANADDIFYEDIAGVELYNGVRFMTHNETSLLWNGFLYTVYDFALYPNFQKVELVKPTEDLVHVWQQEVWPDDSPNVRKPYFCRTYEKPTSLVNQGDVAQRVVSFTYEGMDDLDGRHVRRFTLVMKQQNTSNTIAVTYWDSLDKVPVAFMFEHPSLGTGRIDVLELRAVTEDSPEVKAATFSEPDADSCPSSTTLPKLTSPFAVRGKVVTADDNSWIEARRRMTEALSEDERQALEDHSRSRAETWASLDHDNGTGFYEWPQWAIDVYGGVHPAHRQLMTTSGPVGLSRVGRALAGVDCTNKTWSLNLPLGVCSAEVSVINKQYFAGSLACAGTIVEPIELEGSAQGNMCEQWAKGCISVNIGLAPNNWLMQKLGIGSIQLLEICAGYDFPAGVFYLETTFTIGGIGFKAEISAVVKFTTCCTWIDEIKIEGFMGIDVGIFKAWYSFGDIKLVSNYYLRGNPISANSELSPTVVNLNTWISAHDGWWGTWQNPVYCGDNVYSANPNDMGSKQFIGRPIVGFSLRIEDQQGNCCDDTALNGVKIQCMDGSTQMVYEGLWGGDGQAGWYGPKTCDGGRYFTGVTARVEDQQGSWTDDTAMNSVEFACGYNKRRLRTDDTTTAYGIDVHGGYWGSWRGWKWCPSNTYVCGIQIRFEDAQGSLSDDTALNGLRAYCCNWP